MTSNRVSTLLAVLLAGALAIVPLGCSSQQQQQAEPMENDEAATTETPAEPAASQPAAMQPAAAATPQESPAEQKKKAFIEAFLARADSLIAAGQLEEAQKSVLEALNLDGTNAAAQAKLQQINEMLGQSTETQDMVQQVVEYKQAQRERKLVEVNDLFVRAQQLFADGRYDEALSKLELAELTMRYDPHQTDFGTLPSDVAAFAAQVKATKEREAAALEEREYRDALDELRAEEEKERRRRTEMIRAYMVAAADAFQRQDFDESENLGLKILDISPSFRRAKDIVEFSRRARHSAWRKSFYARRAEQMQRWKEEIRDTQIPWHDIIQFPSRREWDEKTRLRTRTDSVQASLEDSEQVRALKNILENVNVTWEFSDMTLNEAVQFIRDTQNVNVLLSKTALEEKGEETVDFKVRDLKFGDALKEMLAPLELRYTFRYDMIFIATNTETFGNLIPKVYEVRDLTIQLPNFRPPNLNLRPGPAGESAQIAVFGEELERTIDTEPDQLLELVRQNVAPETWDNVEGVDVQINSGQLVAVTTPEIHAEIEAFLEDLRRFSKVIVHVETRFISYREGFLSEIGVDFRGTGGSNPGQIALLDDVTNGPDDNASAGLDNNGAGLPATASLSPSSGAFFQDQDFDVRGRSENIFTRALGTILSNTGGLSFGVTLLDDWEIGALIRAVEKSIYANVLTAPRLTIYNNQRANLTIVNQVSYVKDYDVEVAQTAFIADPLVDIVQDGLVLDVRPTVSYDRKYVTLEVRPTVATLNRPIQTFVTSLAGLTTQVIIELPEIEYKSAATTVKVPDNGYLVIGGLKDLSTVDRRSETPVLSQIPLLSFFFSKKGRSDELSDLMILIHVKILDLNEQEANLTR